LCQQQSGNIRANLVFREVCPAELENLPDSFAPGPVQVRRPRLDRGHSHSSCPSVASVKASPVAVLLTPLGSHRLLRATALLPEPCLGVSAKSRQEAIHCCRRWRDISRNDPCESRGRRDNLTKR